MPELAGLSHIELTVTSADRSARWYEETLGFQRLAEFDSIHGRIVNIIHPSFGLILGFLTHAKGVDGEFSELRLGLDHLSFAVESRDALDEWQAYFDETGVRYSEIIDIEFASVLSFRDPDNLPLELFALAME